MTGKRGMPAGGCAGAAVCTPSCRCTAPRVHAVRACSVCRRPPAWAGRDQPCVIMCMQPPARLPSRPCPAHLVRVGSVFKGIIQLGCESGLRATRTCDRQSARAWPREDSPACRSEQGRATGPLCAGDQALSASAGRPALQCWRTERRHRKRARHVQGAWPSRAQPTAHRSSSA